MCIADASARHLVMNLAYVRRPALSLAGGRWIAAEVTQSSRVCTSGCRSSGTAASARARNILSLRHFILGARIREQALAPVLRLPNLRPIQRGNHCQVDVLKLNVIQKEPLYVAETNTLAASGETVA